MPSKRKQLNVRLSDENQARLESLMARVPVILGVELTQGDLIGMALVELERRYPEGYELPPIEPAKPAKRGQRKPKKEST